MPPLFGEARAPAPRHIFAIVCCIRSTSVQKTLNETSLYRTLFPSLGKTISARERKLWRVRLYLCADDNDMLFKENSAQVTADTPPGLDTRLLFVPAKANRVPSREAAEQARPRHVFHVSRRAGTWADRLSRCSASWYATTGARRGAPCH